MKPLLATLGLVGILVLAACGGGYSKPPSHPTTTAKSPGQGSKPATKFSVANVSGVGNVVVDGKGRTVYILTNAAKKNVPCTDASGCTGAWPDLPFPDGTSAATAGSGINASLLGSMKLSDGETYPTYNGYLMYEYSGDSSSGQANGQGLKSYGGTWYVLNSSGNPVKSGSGGGGYSY